ncbi:MAG: AAA domain-containing protein [Bryobacteraceae bacterium]
MSHTDRIQQLLTQKPGLRAQQIATELGLDRTQVSAALQGALGVHQDRAYRWWPKAQDPRPPQPAEEPRPTLLGALCRYYLECLTCESGAGVSIPASAAGGEYLPLRALPFVSRDVVAPESERAVRKMIQKARRERGQLALYIGYALRLRVAQTSEGEEMRIEPVLLYPLQEGVDDVAGTSPPPAPVDWEEPDLLKPAGAVPLFNLEALKHLRAADSGNVIDEATHLSDELGLANPDMELPPWDEIMLRLRHCRPEWDWKEDLNPSRLSEGDPLSELNSPGIYNRAVLLAASRSPFTYGLEVELRKLANQEEETLRDTALGLWLRPEALEAPAPEDRPVIELLPLNTEQRQAVIQGLSAPLTVVTGPPGTGKSQVVISLLANVAWQGGSVLFASKNNHAVDVVESRVNELGSHPLLLRLGKEEHQVRLIQNLSAGLAESSSAEDAAGYAWLARAHEEARQRFAAVQREISSVVALRNAVDEKERAAEPARAIFGEECFAGLRTFDEQGIRRRLDSLARALETARGPGRTAVARLWRSWKPADGLTEELSAAADRLGVPFPSVEPSEDNLDIWAEFHRALADRLEWASRAYAYWRSLDELRQARPLEHLAHDLSRIADESAGQSLDLWRRWLRVWPSRWNADHRRTLAEYLALLQMVAGGEWREETAGKRVFRRYYGLFPKVTRILPCWAVTSLSARGRLPLEPALFDLVVIDEASQCDIASALPLLFRARRAVIIGDPLQLKHVSTVAPQQDRQVLSAHGLAEGTAAWAYSVNSLFDLARSLCRHEHIVNLRDHHRSHRDIISFSNRHFYRGALRVATDHDRLHRPPAAGPAVQWVDVRGRVARPSGGGALNRVEAEAVVGEVRKLVLRDGYSGAIGVVTPFRAQANRIRTLVHHDRELSGRLAALQFVVDTVHGFQGDERDVIFFSPVVSPGVGESTLRFLNRNGYLFNVAVTRARSALIVVGDTQAALDSGVDYLASFAEYARDFGRGREEISRVEAGPEYPPVPNPERVSEWEKVFYRAMYHAGLRPIPQYDEAPYTLDFALFGGERRLDIEVDGENYHRNWDGELCRRDQIRSRRLNDLGWEVMRFWVYEVRDDLERSVERVRAWPRDQGAT